MITLPATFDYSLLMSDFFSLSLPFIVIAALFVGYRLIVKVIGNAG